MDHLTKAHQIVTAARAANPTLVANIEAFIYGTLKPNGRRDWRKGQASSDAKAVFPDHADLVDAVATLR